MQITTVIQMLRVERSRFAAQDDDGAALLPLAASDSLPSSLRAVAPVEQPAARPLTLERLEQAQSALLRRAA